jgi:hypothetical protein
MESTEQDEVINLEITNTNSVIIIHDTGIIDAYIGKEASPKIKEALAYIIKQLKAQGITFH